MHPKLSIITICRNEKYIEETCRSIAEQVFKDFEWIVIDGASDDGTVDVLERYRKHMSYFVSEPDSGRYNAMNKGILQAKGEYLLFLNGGDSLFDAAVLERLFNYQAVHAIAERLRPKLEADILYGQVVARETGFMPWPLWSVGPQDFSTYFRSRSLPHQATFIRRESFEKFGLYDESYQFAGDYEWFIRAIVKHKAATEYLPFIVSIYNFLGVSSLDRADCAEETLRAKAQYGQFKPWKRIFRFLGISQLIKRKKENNTR